MLHPGLGVWVRHPHPPPLPPPVAASTPSPLFPPPLHSYEALKTLIQTHFPS